MEATRLINPLYRPEVAPDLSENVILTSVNDLYNWARLSSLWPLLFGTACCFIEFAALLGARYDFDRMGLIPRATPRQSDLLITAGTVTMKMAPALVKLYHQMPEPKYVIAMGTCTITGGMFSTDSYTTVRGVDKLFPVDVYMPGCPPRPEAIIDAIIKLRKKIANEDVRERFKQSQTHRYFTVAHQLRAIPEPYPGVYLESQTRRQVPVALPKTTALPLAQTAQAERISST
ncbi:NADH-quinone oxidoreductase subunit NuoB [Anthocerotibacter panamensis]|uniref:NADH-quinone oxidoreductase subunit NuoB n=1 Tax=Anthocerotibacter panamensis TaxID=2857077 RepID=UPI001C403EBA|nr:NADH-quinone oxidoreductase subunit NuoB [Anthocerotibacter panamensis]